MHPDVAIYSQLRRGQIQIEPGWQLISVPSRLGEWNAGTGQVDWTATAGKVGQYVVAQLVDVYGPGVVTSCNAKFGGTDNWYNYTPGVTPDESADNFALMPYDAELGAYEPVGFWIFSAHGSAMILDFTELR